MFRNLLRAIVLIPVAIILVAWALANRAPVVVSFDPFNASEPAFALSVPLYAVCFVVLIAGVLIGGAATWLKQGRWRRARARLAAENNVIRTELERHRRAANPRDRNALTVSPMVNRPPAA